MASIRSLKKDIDLLLSLVLEDCMYVMEHYPEADKEKVNASQIIQNAGAAFVKTCTGCSPDPVALYEDIRLIRQTIGPQMGLKASGRVGNYFRLKSMVEAGATRVGLILPQAREIIRGWEEENK